MLIAREPICLSAVAESVLSRSIRSYEKKLPRQMVLMFSLRRRALSKKNIDCLLHGGVGGDYDSVLQHKCIEHYERESVWLRCETLEPRD